MSIELKIPDVGESIQEVQIGKWLKKPGDQVAEDEPVVELETDKASMELPAPADGVMGEIVKQEGDSAAVGDVIGYIDEGRQQESGKKDKQASEKKAAAAAAKSGDGRDKKSASDKKRKQSAKAAKAKSDAADDDDQPEHEDEQAAKKRSSTATRENVAVTPAARRLLRKHGLKAEQIPLQGARLRPEDIEQYLSEQSGAVEAVAETEDEHDREESALEEVVPMSLIRRRIAEQLVSAQQEAALLTTFNEIDMSAIVALRRKQRDRFQDKYGVKLGFMSFFVRAVIDGLVQFPGLNAEIRDERKIAYRNYYHIGIAVGGGKGLVVPVLRHAEEMSFAEIERAIADLAQRAQQNKLEPAELAGGTFTISNGGVYGSLLSTPIVNPPQSGVLGMHTIQQRPVARRGQVVIRPMMYVALTYDHRIVDGREAVQFLKRVKDAVEEPERIFLEV